MAEQPPSPRPGRGIYELHSTIPRARFQRNLILETVRAGARRSHTAFGSVNFVLVDDRKMARLHREFAGIRGTTDVLTFDLTENGSIEGDIYICLDQARRQARAYRVSLSMELARLAVHGILHLAGHSDATAAGRETMRQLEDAALAAARRSA